MVKSLVDTSLSTSEQDTGKSGNENQMIMPMLKSSIELYKMSVLTKQDLILLRS